jgi:hypothetical protein
LFTLVPMPRVGRQPIQTRSKIRMSSAVSSTWKSNSPYPKARRFADSRLPIGRNLHVVVVISIERLLGSLNKNQLVRQSEIVICAEGACP